MQIFEEHVLSLYATIPCELSLTTMELQIGVQRSDLSSQRNMQHKGLHGALKGNTGKWRIRLNICGAMSALLSGEKGKR